MAAIALLVTLAAATAQGAQSVPLDLHDYDDELMRTLDQTVKYFEPDLSAGNATAAAEDAQVLRDGYQWMERYFQAKTGAEDAVKIAQLGEQYIVQAEKYAAEKNFDAAADSAHEAAKTCRVCHDTFKPIKAR